MNTFQKLAQLSGGSYINTTKGNIGQVANLLKVGLQFSPSRVKIP